MPCYDDYIKLLSAGSLVPNFFISEEYFKFSNWSVELFNNCLRVVDVDGEVVLPAISLDGQIMSSSLYPLLSLEGTGDVNFIYNPENFKYMVGKQWRKIRKDLKWAQEDAGESFVLSEIDNDEQITNILSAAGLDNRDDLYDPDVIVLYSYTAKNRKLLKGRDTGKIYGLLVWDYNHVFINFRYCWVIKNIRGLSSTARILFYQYIAPEKMMVNDGGDLDSPELHRYKKYLNPEMIMYQGL